MEWLECSTRKQWNCLMESNQNGIIGHTSTFFCFPLTPEQTTLQAQVNQAPHVGKCMRRWLLQRLILTLFQCCHASCLSGSGPSHFMQIFSYKTWKLQVKCLNLTTSGTSTGCTISQPCLHGLSTGFALADPKLQKGIEIDCSAHLYQRLQRTRNFKPLAVATKHSMKLSTCVYCN